MSAIQVGALNSLILQADQTLTVSPEGIGEARVTYKAPWSKLYSWIPAPNSGHPTFGQLLLYESSTAQEPGDIGAVTLIYRGVFTGNSQALTQYEFNCTVSSEPIETHPRFAQPQATPPVTTVQLAAINKAIENNVAPDRSIVPVDSAADTLYIKKVRGIDSYLRAGGTYRVSYVDTGIPGGYDDVGHIASPPGNAPYMNGANYLFVGLSWRKTGGVVSIQKDYQLSGPGQWDGYLYGAYSIG